MAARLTESLLNTAIPPFAAAENKSAKSRSPGPRKKVPTRGATVFESPITPPGVYDYTCLLFSLHQNSSGVPHRCQPHLFGLPLPPPNTRADPERR